MLWDFMRCSEQFLSVLSSSEKSLKILSHYLTFWRVLRCSEAFSWSFLLFLKVLEGYEVISNVLNSSEAFSWALSNSEWSIKVMSIL